ncbi:MAG: hypothetical protein ACREV5_03580 [Steroidobacter sp.]
MHASIHELLSLRDAEPVEARTAQHVHSCAQCAHELQQLSLVRTRLQDLPQIDAPAGAWAQIQHAASASPSRTASWRWTGAAVAAVAMLTVIVGVVLREDESQIAAAPESVRTVPAEDDRRVADLVAQSQELEHLLQALPERPLIERVSTAATIDTIQQRIQWLDFQLSYAPEDGLDDVQSQRLWRERVDLMDSLVKVRYAEARRLSF